MKEFFLLFGVQEDIKLIQFNEEQHNELVAAYRFKQTETLFRYSSLQFQRCLTLPFLEVTQNNYDFALYFWQHVIHSINANQLNESELLLCDQQPRKVDNLPYWFVRNRVCIPTTARELKKSTDVFSSDLRSIAGDLLPVFACSTSSNPFPTEWQRFFQFKTQLSIPDHIQLLNLIYDRSKNSPLNDENETCIHRIYTSLINCLSKIDRRQLDQYRPKSPFYLLSTENNEFLPSTNLVISLSKDFTLPNQIPQLKLSTGNSRDFHLSHFLDFFNIRQIGINDLTLLPNNAQPSLVLRAKLRDMQPHLFELAHSRNIMDHRIDHDLEVFEVDRLELYYNGTIPVLQLHIHVIENRIYVTHPWNSKEVMSKLPQILCKQFKLPSNIESDIHQFLVTEQTTSSTLPLTLNPSVDLLRMDGTRAKFAMLIDRDNDQLFSHLGITDTTSPADLLTIGLDAQHSSFGGYVYHYTHLENAASILRDHALKCRNNLSPNDFKDSSAKHVTQTTRNEVKDYARFYFRPLTPMQYCNENLGLSNLSNKYGNQPICPVPIFFRIKLDALLAIENIQWKISLGNLANPQTEFDNTMNTVRKFDFRGVYDNIRTERGMYSSHQEFLIKSQLNFDELKPEHIEIICPDENARCSLQHMISHSYSSIIGMPYYYGLNSRVKISPPNNENEIIVFINGINPLRVDGQLILQLSGDDTNRTIHGNLKASFQRGTISTVYSNQQLSFMADLNHVRYAVYYEHENQMWLIHTNSAGAHFIQPV